MIEWFVQQVISLIDPIAELGKERRALADSALSALSTALTETCLYYRELGEGCPRQPKQEAQLARLWATAAVPLRHIDRHLAETCQMKSKYWVNPDTWAGDAEDQLRMGLDLLQRNYSAMLAPPRPKRKAMRIAPKLTDG